MKKIILILGLIFLVGCSFSDQNLSEKNKDQVVLESSTVDSDEIIEKQTEPESEDDRYAIYAKWAITPEDQEYIMIDNSGRKDCVGVLNGFSPKGDLLSTLIVDDNFRQHVSYEWPQEQVVNLEVYSKDYLVDLEKRIASYTQQTYASDFYAYYVCNLGDGIDVASGVLVPQGQNLENLSREERWNTPDLIVISGSKGVYGISDVKTFDNTATGAEVGPCSASLKDELILWGCFLGLAQDETGVTGSAMGFWEFSLTGEIIRQWEEDALI